MTPFAQAVSTWANFYIMLGGAAAALTGLLFVSLSINLKEIREASRIQLRSFVSQTFFYFLFVLLFSAIFLIPNQSPTGLGSPLLAIGILGLLNAIRQVVQAARLPVGQRRMRFVLILPVIDFAGLVLVSTSILGGNSDSLNWMVVIMLVLISLATANAYRLLIDLSEI